MFTNGGMFITSGGSRIILADDGLGRMSFLDGLRNQWGRRSSSVYEAVRSHDLDAPPTDRLSPDRLANVLSLMHSDTPAEATTQLTDGVSQPISLAGPSLHLQAPSSVRGGALGVLVPVDLAPVDWAPVVPERVAPERVAPERVAPERVAPERVAPERVAPERVAPERVAPERVAPERVAPERIVAAPVVAAPVVAAPEVPAPEVRATGRHRSPTSPTPISFRRFGVTSRRSAQLGVLILLVVAAAVIGVLFA